ncbi:MAG: pirin family protein [Caulobacteraceae bacterium]|nr:pirin family protein [Caulobacteraceae bacterium]
MIDAIITANRKSLGDFEVGRVLPSVQRRMVGPFIFLDHMGPADFQPGQGVNVRPHPHIGLSTVTYLFEGEIIHRDSLGFTQAIRPGEVNWMTAGKGITHSERTDPFRRDMGARLHGMQAWVALPDGQEEIEPNFEHYQGKDMPAYEGDGLYARLIAGEAYGAKSKVRTSSPLFYVHWEMGADVKATPPDGYSERAAYVVSGEIEVDGRFIQPGQMVVFTVGARPVVRSVKPSTVMLLGGEPVGERHIWWNFVSSSMDRIEQAKDDWREGRMHLPVGDDLEFIPLPDTPPPPSRPTPGVTEDEPGKTAAEAERA